MYLKMNLFQKFLPFKYGKCYAFSTCAGLSQSYWEKQYNLFTKNLKYYLDKKFSKMENIIDMETEL